MIMLGGKVKPAVFVFSILSFLNILTFLYNYRSSSLGIFGSHTIEVEENEDLTKKMADNPAPKWIKSGAIVKVEENEDLTKKNNPVPKWTKSGATSKMFSGERTRSFPKEKLKFQSYYTVSTVKKEMKPRCEKWGVLTTIFQVSKAVQRQVKLRDWCLVVVLDKRSIPTYNTGWFKGEGHNAVIVLSISDQEKMAHPFAKRLPWNCFGRKNIGYLYAIQHGATIIWDFDDDNALKFWLSGAAPPGAPSLDYTLQDFAKNSLKVKVPLKHSWPTYNPYPALGAPSAPCWPRGLPLDDIKESKSYDTPLVDVHMKAHSVGVLQSLAEYQPDVDAVYRLTMPIPFFFRRTVETTPLVVPFGVLTPYNAQATLHFKSSFFSLFLPVTVTGRVSDIWRSYIAQRLFWDVGLHIGFAARPLVVQDRNIHSNIADFTSEDHLYTRAKKMVEFLGSWKGHGNTIVTRTEELWIALYERHYVEMEDVKLLQFWLQNLIDIGYSFPEIVESKNYFVPLYPPLHPTESMNEENEDDTENCTWDKKTLTLWTSDIHDGTKLDVPQMLAAHGHQIIVARKKTERSYSNVTRMKTIELYFNTSKVLNSFGHILLERKQPMPVVKENMLKENFEFFKSNSKISQVDLFLCQFSFSTCKLWIPFNKTIAFVPAHRYNMGMCTKEEWLNINKNLKFLANEKRHIIGADSVYNQEYMQHYTGITPLPLYHYCGQYTNNPSLSSFNPYKKEILLFSQSESSQIQLKEFELMELYKSYTAENILNHRALVYIPNAVASDMLCEFYSLGVPLFIPSMKYLRTENYFGPGRLSFPQNYCKNYSSLEVISAHPNSLHPYSPDIGGSTDLEAECYWLQMADFYQWPHITHFDDIPDLETKLESADFERIHRLMITEVQHKKKAIENAWCKTLKKVQTGRKIPLNYNTALYNMSSLLVH